MELDELITVICNKVQEKVDALESGGQSSCCGCGDSEKPGLLVLAQNHGTICHPTYENSRLAECYHMDCALLMEDGYDVADYEGVIAYTLTNDALGKIADGIFDTDYTKAFGTALLQGKKVFVPEEEVELFKYKDSAPERYYKKLEAHLTFLESCGVTIVPNDCLIDTILDGGPAVTREPENTCCCCAREEKTVSVTKKVLTERDIVNAKDDGVTCIKIEPKAILTDLAKDCAKKYKIELVREGA